MEKSVEILAGLVKQDPEKVAELLGSEEGVTEFQNSVKDLKVYTNDEFLSVTDNLRKSYKDSVYNEVKGASLEMLEKDIMKQYGLDLKRGEDYQNAMDLVSRVITDSATKAGEGDENLRNEIKSLQEALRAKGEEYEANITSLNQERDGEIANYLLDGAMKSIKPLVDAEDNVVDGQLELFRIAFSQNYETRKDDGSYKVWDRKAEQFVQNEDYSYATVDQVVAKIAPSYLTFKDVTPKKGRGSEFTQSIKKSNSGRINTAKYNNDFNVYYNEELKGKGVQFGSKEANDAYRQFREAMSS